MDVISFLKIENVTSLLLHQLSKHAPFASNFSAYTDSHH
jgi:hypothetical protein